MTKKMLRDILPKNNDNLMRRKQRDSEGDVLYHRVSPERAEYRDSKKTRKTVWTLVVLVLVIVLFSIFYITAGAKVTIVPKVYNLDINVNLTAINQEDADLLSGNDNLVFKESVVSKIGGKDVVPDGEREVERKASGTIVIYNTYNSSSQRLIKNTRFESAGGKIYRINQSVVVPGQKTVDGEVIPGSVEAVVYADEPGESYNLSDSVTFTIPGLKSDTKRYNNFYAKNPEPIEGGFVGSMKYVSDDNQKTVRAEIRSELETEILKDAVLNLPDGFIMPKGSFVVEFESLPTEEKNGNVAIKEKATLTMFIFKASEWDRIILNKSSLSENSGAIEFFIKNRNELVVDWTKRPEKGVPEINFNVSGLATFVSVVDVDSLKNSLAGQKKKDLNNVISNFSSIKRAEAVISPIWKRSFPQDGSEIEVVVVTDEE